MIPISKQRLGLQSQVTVSFVSISLDILLLVHLCTGRPAIFDLPLFIYFTREMQGDYSKPS